MAHAFYYSGKDFFQALKEALQKARTEILVSLYTFQADESGEPFIELLSTQARRGVRVRVVFDDLGSRHQASLLMPRLTSAGVEARAFRPLGRMLLSHPLKFFCRDHARIFLIDRETFGTGGIGFGNIYHGREDFSMLTGVEDPERIVAYFDWLWELADNASLRKPFPIPDRHLAPGLSMLYSGPRREDQEIYRWTRKCIAGAACRIALVTPFFFPNRTLLRALIDARKRGVEVDIITPLRTDKPRYDRFRAVPAELLAKYGVRWLGVDTYFHQKFFICDDAWTFGSANFDVVSLQRNYELNLAGEGGATLGELEKIVTAAKERCRSRSPLPEPRYLRILRKLFYPIAEFFFALT